MQNVIRTYQGVLCAAACAMSGVCSVPAVADIHTFTFALEGSQEVPPNDSPATGGCVVELDDVLRTISIECWYEGLLDVCNNAHLHGGEPGENGGVIIGLSFDAATSGTATGAGNLQLAQIQAVLDGNTYVNIHSAVLPGGEIRGQVVNAPEPVRVCGLEHHALGSASISGMDTDGNGGLDRLIISEIGSSGEDGVRVVLANIPNNGTAAPDFRVRGWRAAIDFGPAGALEAGMRLRLVPRDRFGNTGPAMILEEVDGGQSSLTVAPGCPECTITARAYRRGVLVAEVVREGDGDLIVTGVLGSVPGDGINDLIVPEIAYQKRFGGHFSGISGYTFLTIVNSAPPPSGEMLEADTVIFEVANPADSFDAMTEVEIRASFPSVVGELIIEAQGMVAGTNEASYEILENGAGKFMRGSVQCESARRGTSVCIGAIEVSDIDSSINDGLTVRSNKQGDPNANRYDFATDASDDPGAGTGTGHKLSWDPIMLDLDADGISSLRIGSQWQSSTDSDIVSMFSWLQATGGPDGELTVHVDFSEIDADEMCVEVWDGGIRVASTCISALQSISVHSCPASAPVRCRSATNANHMNGEHAAGFVWEFGGSVCVSLDQDLDPIIGGELRISPARGVGGGASSQPVVTLRGADSTHLTASSSGGGAGTMHITGIEQAAVSFTGGHIFGLHHTATDGATMTLGCGTDCSLPAGAGRDRLPLVVGGGSGGVTIHTGAAEFFSADLDDFLVLSPEGQDLRLVGTASGTDEGAATMLHEFELVVVDSVDLHSRTSFAPSGSLLQTISLYNEGELVAELTDMPNNTNVEAPYLPAIYTVKSTSNVHRQVAKVQVRGWNPRTAFSIGGQVFEADAVQFTAQDPEFILPLSHVTLEMQGDLSAFAIVDEAIGMFGPAHRAIGIGRFGCCMDSDGDGLPDLLSIHGTDGASVSGIYSDWASGLWFDTYDTRESVRTSIDVPDPCAGLPPDCISWPDGATLRIKKEIECMEWMEGTARGVQLVECTMPPGGGPLDVRPDFSGIEADVFTLEVLQDDQIIATYDLPKGTSIEACCVDACCAARSSDGDEWPSSIRSGFASQQDPFPRDFGAVLGWNSPRQFTVQGSEESHLGNALRFSASISDGEVCGMTSQSITTIAIPVLHMTAMEFIDAPTICIPGDVNCDGIVNVQDLLMVISNWGNTCDPGADCPGDGNDDGIVNVQDLLLVISNWGATA